jgi:hypothetical protein
MLVRVGRGEIHHLDLAIVGLKREILEIKHGIHRILVIMDDLHPQT